MRKLFIFFILTSTCYSLMAQEASSITIGEEFQLYSHILNEQRSIMISLPASYEGDDFYRNKRYPVLILLDGGSQFYQFAGIQHFLSQVYHGNERVPEMILIGIRNTNRNRDFRPTIAEHTNPTNAGGADRFLAFLQQELLPYIDSSYRSLPFRVLAGHSYGGLLATHAFVEHQAFNGYLAIDPSLHWDQAEIVERLKGKFGNQNSHTSLLYIAQANNPFQAGPRGDAKGRAIQEFFQVLSANEAFVAEKAQLDFFEKEDHFSVPTLAIYQGLLFLFKGYLLPPGEINRLGPGKIREHYQAFEDRMGMNIGLPFKGLQLIAQFLNGNHTNGHEKAIEIYELLHQQFPDHPSPLEGIGHSYQQMGEQALANKYLDKARNLRQEN